LNIFGNNRKGGGEGNGSRNEEEARERAHERESGETPHITVTLQWSVRVSNAVEKCIIYSYLGQDKDKDERADPLHEF